MEFFPIKVKPYQGELISSWISRLANENAMMAASLVGHVGFGKQVQTDFDLHAAPQLIEILTEHGLHDGDEQRLYRTMIAGWGEKTGSLFQCMRRWILPAGHRHPRIRFCALCLQEYGYYRKIWRLNWYAACHRHKVVLRDHCHVCLSPQVLCRTSWKHRIGCCTNCMEPLWTATSNAPFDDVDYWHSVAISLNKLRQGTSQKDASRWFQVVWMLTKWLEKLRCDGKEVGLYLSEPLDRLRETFPEAVAFYQARILWDEEPFQLKQLIATHHFEFDRITYHRCPRPLKVYRRSKDWRMPSMEQLESAIQEIKQLREQVTYFRIAEIAGCSYETIRKYDNLDSFVRENVCEASIRRLRS